MKKTIIITILLGGFLLHSATLFAQLRETRKLSGYDKIKIGGGFEVELLEAEEELIQIESENLPLDKIITEVDKDGTLKVVNKVWRKKFGEIWEESKYLDGEYPYTQSGKVTIVIQYKKLVALSNAGSGKVAVTSPVNQAKFELKQSGSGEVRMASLITQNLSAHLRGSGVLRILAGTCQAQNIQLSGSGEVDLSKLLAQTSEGSVRGSGKISLNVQKNLAARVSGSGSIQYLGNPATSFTKTSGSGHISRVDGN
jgi:hypothetical protein